MKKSLLIFTILALALCSDQIPGLVDSSETLANLFIAKTDTARRINVRSLANDPRVFQLAYGLKRQKRYDLIRQFFHPNVQDIVLYGSQPFYITVGTNDQGGIDSTYDWFLSASRYGDSDRRDIDSTYVNVHAPGWQNKRWTLTPANLVYPDGAFYIRVHDDETKTDGISQKGWYLTAGRFEKFDKKSGTQTRLIVSKNAVDSNFWVLTPQLGGDCFAIQLANDGTRQDNNDMTGWFLGRGDIRTKAVSPDDVSLYAVAQAGVPNHLWSIKMAS